MGITPRTQGGSNAQEPAKSQAETPLLESAKGKDKPILRTGDYVRVTGLQSRPHLNGKTGMLLDYDSETCRWKVVMCDGSGYRLKSENLTAEASEPEEKQLPDLVQEFVDQQTQVIAKALEDCSKYTVSVLSEHMGLYCKAAGQFHQFQ